MVLATTRRKVNIGPLDHGQKMSLKAFEFVKTQEGYHYELSRGYITVSEPANIYQALMVAFMRNELAFHQRAHPDQIFVILTEMACKLLIPEWESERHPDIAVYLTKPAGKKDRTIWRNWFPEFVIEVTSPDSDHRDYVEKRDEYWTLGVKEYWIVDPKRKQVVVLRRGKSDWIEKRTDADGVCETKLLPSFQVRCQAIFDAAAVAEES